MRIVRSALAALALVSARRLPTAEAGASHVCGVAGTSSRLPMAMSEVIRDLEAEGATKITTCAFLCSQSVTQATRARLFRSLFGVVGGDEYDTKVEYGATSAFSKKMGEEHEEEGATDAEEDPEGVGVVVANPAGSGRGVAETAAAVQACGGTIVYVADATDLDRGEGLFDTLAPALERYLASCADEAEGGLGSLAQADRKAALVVVVDGADVAVARRKFEAAAATMLNSIVQPAEGKRCKALQEAFDRVEFVPSTVPVHDLLCEMGGTCTDPDTAALAIRTAVTDLEQSGTAAKSGGLARPVDLAAARRLGPASRAAQASVLEAVGRAATAEDGSGTPLLVEDFGDLCDAAVKSAVEAFDAEAGSLLKQSAVARRIRHSLLEEVYAELSDLYELQVQELREATMEAYQRGLSQLRLTANLANDMDRVVKDSVSAFISRAKKLRAKGCRGISPSWASAEAVASDVRRELIETSAHRLGVARVEGKFKPAPRKGVTIGLHWLLPKPFGNDYRQEPWDVHAKDNLIYVPRDKITDVSKSDVKSGDWRKSVVPNPTGSEMLYLQ